MDRYIKHELVCIFCKVTFFGRRRNRFCSLRCSAKEQRKNIDQSGKNNPNWKGIRAKYQAFHKRLYTQMGKPKKCDICGTEDENKHYDWANLTGKYNDPKDYKRMCRSCHCKYDGIYKNIKRKKR